VEAHLPPAALVVLPAQARLVVVAVSLNPILKLSAVLQHNPRLWQMLEVVVMAVSEEAAVDLEVAVATANSEVVLDTVDLEVAVATADSGVAVATVASVVEAMATVASAVEAVATVASAVEAVATVASAVEAVAMVASTVEAVGLAVAIADSEVAVDTVDSEVAVDMQDSDASFEPGNIEQRTVGDMHTKGEPRTCEHDVSATFV